MRPVPALLLLGLAAAAGCGPGHYFVRMRVTDGQTGCSLPGAIVTIARSGMMAAVDTSGFSPATEATPGDTVTVTMPGYLEASTSLSALRRDDTAVIALIAYPDLPRTVEGHVLDAVSRRGLADALVRVADGERSTRSGPGGFFRLDDFPAGPRTVVAACDGYVDGSAGLDAAGGETTRVDIALRDTTDEGAVEGTVFDAASGRPIPGVTVRVEESGDEAVTDAEGRFRIGRVPAGDHGLTVFADAYGFKTIPFRVTKGWTVRVDFALTAPGRQ